MNKINNDTLILCNLQGKVFVESLSRSSTSSEIFIRRFMNSNIAKTIDSGAILDEITSPVEICEVIEEEYGKSFYGKVRYAENELFWIGYFYRCMSNLKNISSKVAYKMVKPRELREVFLAYHTLSIEQAVDRVLEAKELLLSENDEQQRQLTIMKKIRTQTCKSSV